MTAQFQFVMRSGPTPGKVFLLEGPEIIIGRENTCTIMINDIEVSRKHARLVWKSIGYVLEDLGSTNGTFIKGKRLIAPSILQGGECVTLAENIILVYESALDPDDTLLSTSASAFNQAIADAQPISEVSDPETSSDPSQPDSTPDTISPSQPAPFNLEPVQSISPKRSKRNSVFLLVVVLGLLCVCGVIAIFLYRAPISFWCNTFPANLIFKPELYPQCVPY